MIRTAIYCRVSTDVQAKEGDSVQAQLSALRKYIKEHEGHICIGEFVDDGLSGTKFEERDELQKLLDLVKRDEVDKVIFTRMDRWFRSIKHYVATQDILEQHNVSWLAIWEPVYDTTTPQGKLVVHQMMSIAEFEAANTAIRINKVFDYKKTQREVLSGKVPFGYSIENKHLVPNENADTVRLAFDTYIKTNSMSETIRLTQGLGLPVTQRAMKHLLQNEKYIGRGYGHDDFCPAIVDKDTFDKVQRLLAMNVRKGRIHDYIFSGLIVCNDCGNKMAGSYDTYKRTGEKYFTYRCTGYYRPIKICGNSKCPNEKKLEKYLVQNLERFAFEEVEVKDAKDTVDYGKLIEATERKIAREKELYVNELITLEEYRKDVADFQTQIIEYKKKLSENQSTGRDELKRLVGQNLADWYWTLDNKEKRTLWRSVIKEIRIGYDKEIHVVFL